MESTEVKRKMNMFKYVGNYTLYDILGEYYPELENDYSTAKLLNNISPDLAIDNKFFSYYKIFDELAKKLLEKVQKQENEEDNTIPKEQLDILYENLKKNDTSDYLDSFDTVEEYIQYAIDNPRNRDLKPLRDIIIDASLKFSDISTEEKNNYRTSVIGLYILAIGQKLKEKYPTSEERENPKNEEWQEFIDLRKFLGNPDKRNIYDEFLKGNKKNKEIKTAPLINTINNLQEQCREIEEQQDLNDRCVAYRSYLVNNEIFEGLTEEEKEKLKKGETKDTVSTILGDFRKYPTPNKGTYVWDFKEIEPKVILDTVADYSEDQVENQRVIAVSYGYLNFGTDISIDTRKPTQNSSYELELVGVTRKGIEGDSTYFTFTTFDNTTMKNKNEITDADDVLVQNYYFNGKQGMYYNKETGEELVLVKSNERIPKELEQYYAQIFFSDIYMQATNKFYSRYSGTVIDDEGKPHISYQKPLKVVGISSKDYLKAVKYATLYPAEYKGKTKITMEEFINSDYLKNKQAEIVEDVLKKDKKSKENIDEEDKSVKQEDDEPLL